MLQYKIYLLTFPNGKHYCGYTSQTLEHRWRNGRGYESCPLVYKAIQKYGWGNIKKQVIATYAQQDYAYSKERQVIRELQLTNPEYGYNIDQGGRPTGCSNITQETRQKLSVKSKARWQNSIYKTKTIEAMKAGPHHKQSQETRKKISEIKKAQHNIPVNLVKVKQYTKDGLFIKEFASATYAARALNKSDTAVSNILAAAKGKRPTAYGYRWELG